MKKNNKRKFDQIDILIIIFCLLSTIIEMELSFIILNVFLMLSLLMYKIIINNKNVYVVFIINCFFVMMSIILGASYSSNILGIILNILLVLYNTVFILRIGLNKSILSLIVYLLLLISVIFNFNSILLLICNLIIMIELNYRYKSLKEKKNVMFISSIGGHLTELLMVESLFNKYNYVVVTEKTFISKKLKDKYNIRYLVNCSRYYIFKYVFLSIINIFKSIYLFVRYNPDLVYTTGAHTSVVMCYLAYLFDRKIIFIEVFDRTKTPTLSGRMIYPIASTFIVQHNNFKKIYPDAKYIKGVY